MNGRGSEPRVEIVNALMQSSQGSENRTVSLTGSWDSFRGPEI